MTLHKRKGRSVDNCIRSADMTLDLLHFEHAHLESNEQAPYSKSQISSDMRSTPQRQANPSKFLRHYHKVSMQSSEKTCLSHSFL